ncbi:MAG TPA: hypothetical protein VGS79_24760 [Puia sp.]|nr:hypothetical protein [Puia sp.]
MPIFDITLNVYIFLLIIGLAVVLGYLPRSRQLAKKQRKILELEQEMVQAHAELLENQREYCQLESRLKDIANPNPVISMKDKNRATGTD